MNIKIKKHFLHYKDYKLKFAVGKSGITNNKKEGDLSTPKGIYQIRTLYYRKPIHARNAYSIASRTGLR